MKTFMALALLILGNGNKAFGNESIARLLDSCYDQYDYYLVEAKQDLVKNSIWNYDNDYFVEQVASSEPLNLTDNSFELYIHFDIEGLRDLGHTYSFTPVFQTGEGGECEYIYLEHVSSNY